jgi:hypothetical protein
MSALGQQQTKRHQAALSALHPKADIDRHDGHVCFVPKADEVRRTNCVRGLATNMPASTIGFAGFQV